MHSSGTQQRGEGLAEQALATAGAFLLRWRDRLTVESRDDLVQETAWTAWRVIDRVRDRGRFPAVVRTIARRVRWHALADRLRGARQIPIGNDDRTPSTREACSDCFLRVSGRRVPRSWLRDRLDLALVRVSALNRCLLYSFYEGFSCQELADRHRLSEECVKVRLHRSRLRVRRELECLVRAAGQDMEV